MSDSKGSEAIAGEVGHKLQIRVFICTHAGVQQVSSAKNEDEIDDVNIYQLFRWCWRDEIYPIPSL